MNFSAGWRWVKLAFVGGTAAGQLWRAERMDVKPSGPTALIRNSCLALLALMSTGACAARASEVQCVNLMQEIAQDASFADERVLTGFLFRAAEDDCVEVAASLLEKGALANARRGPGVAVLHIAARDGDPDMAKILLDHGADINLRDLKGAHALFIAAEARRKAMVSLLLERGADINLPGRSDGTALVAAAFNGSDAIVKVLLKAGADPALPDSTGKPAIVYAAARGFQRIVEALLAKGIDINARYAHGLTVLMWAAGHTNEVPEDEGVALVRMLIERGAHVEDQDDRGRTPLMIAAGLDHPGVVSELLKRGAKRDIKDNDGKTAADLAASDAVRAALGKS